MSKSEGRVSTKHSGAISDDASNSEEDEDNRLALEEEQGRVPIFEEVVVPPEYETDEDRPIKGAEPPFDEMDTEDRKALAERVEKQREEDQKKLMLNVLNGSSDDSDHDGFSVQNRQLLPQSDVTELEYADPAAHSMVYPPGSPPAYYSGSDEEGANTGNTHPTISTYQPPAPPHGQAPVLLLPTQFSGDWASPMSNLMMTSINLPITLQKMQKVAAEESDDEREDDDEDGKFYPGGAAPQMKRRMMQTNEDSMGDRKWMDALNTDEKMLIGYFDSFTPEELILDTLYTYIPVEYLPAVGEPDPFIKIPRPDMIDDNTGLLFLDEPAVRQSDPVIVDMQMRTTVKDADKKHVEQEAVPMKNVERADKNKEEIDKWIVNIKELHRSRPTMNVHYSRGMPDVEKLMQEWPDNVERKLKDLTLPTAELDVPLETFVDLVLNTVDIPVNKLVMIIRWTRHVVVIASLLPLIAPRPSLTPEMRDSICTTQCDAQFKSDFRLSFSRDYDLDFFDIPLDPLLVSSLQNLTAFCYLVEQKQECYKTECDLSCEMDVSEHQLCERKAIRDNIACLRDTSPFVQRDCSRLCRSISFHPGERTLTNSSLEEHKHCVFIHCHRMCQESLISRLCPSHSRRAAHEAVRAYYSAYQHDDLRIYVEESNEQPSSFCRRVSGYEENAETRSIHNRNLQILQGIKDQVKEMVETL